jgi:hypothetical protein
LANWRRLGSGFKRFLLPRFREKPLKRLIRIRQVKTGLKARVNKIDRQSQTANR